MVIPNLGLGGAQRAFHDHSVALSQYYEVTEAVFNLNDANLYPSGNSLESLQVAGGGSPVQKIANFFKRISKLGALKSRLHTDICISHLEGADYVNLLSKRKEKIVLLIQGSKTHDRNINGLMGWLRKSVLMPMLYKRANRIVCVSRDIVPEMVDDYQVDRQKLRVINNSFEVAQVQAQSREPLPPAMQQVYAAGPVLVTSGRLAIQKNQQPLLDIFAQLLLTTPAKLVFVGDGELRDELVAYARSLGLRVYAAWDQPALTPDYDVYFVGMQTNPFQYIRPAVAFVFPSAWEGFPLALGEAMACGVPVVTTDCPTGPREMLAPASAIPTEPIRKAEAAEFGLLMPMLTEPATLAADSQVWVATLRQLLGAAPERQRLGEAARLRANSFTHESTFQRWHTLIDEVLAE